MSDVAAPGLVLRGDAAAEAKRHIGQVRSLERERRIRRLTSILGPYFLSACLVSLVVADRYERASHPLPQPEMLVAMVRANGISPPVPIADLTPSDELAVIRSTIINYLVAREEYCQTCMARNYRHVSAISSPEERARYQALMLNDKNPANPKVLYGTGDHAGEAVVDPTKVEITQDRASPNVFNAMFQLMIVPPNGPSRAVTKYASMQWLPARSSIKFEDQQAFSPLGIGCWSYNSYAMETPR
ncbi:MAG: hypothetical protein NVS1B6_02740 [Steroidobacteraceae bacterium]